jgi:hypothetical protein
MKKVLSALLLFLACLTATAQDITYQRADSVKICQLLRQATKTTSPIWFARHFLDVPYVAHTLEVNDTEQLVVNTRQLDCTTFVETVTALTLCARQDKRSWADYTDVLRTLRYRGGVLDGYPSRLHYFTDWIVDKTAMNLVEEIQQPNPPFYGWQHVKVNYMSCHPSSYKALKAHPEWIPVIREQEEKVTGRTFRYIPKAALQRDTKVLRDAIHDGDIIAITCKKKGLDIAHLGFAVWRSDGLHLLNASQLHKKVVVEPMTMYQYLQKHSTHTGIRIIRIKK